MTCVLIHVASVIHGPSRSQKSTDLALYVTAMVAHDPPGRLVKVTRPAVVAEALPEAQHLLLVGRRECSERGPAVHEATEIIHHRGDLGLLEHCFADQHVIGIGTLGR